jgi:hypothetical protein
LAVAASLNVIPARMLSLRSTGNLEFATIMKAVNVFHCDTTPHAVFLLIAPDQAK